MAPWVTLDEARREWADAPLDDERLRFLLEVAQGRCEAFLESYVVPDPTVPFVPEARHRLAVILDAKDAWGAEVGTSDQIGMPDVILSLPTLARRVKLLLRPHRGLKVG